MLCNNDGVLGMVASMMGKHAPARQHFEKAEQQAETSGQLHLQLLALKGQLKVKRSCQMTVTEHHTASEHALQHNSKDDHLGFRSDQRRLRLSFISGRDKEHRCAFYLLFSTV